MRAASAPAAATATAGTPVATATAATTATTPVANRTRFWPARHSARSKPEEPPTQQSSLVALKAAHPAYAPALGVCCRAGSHTRHPVTAHPVATQGLARGIW